MVRERSCDPVSPHERYGWATVRIPFRVSAQGGEALEQQWSLCQSRSRVEGTRGDSRQRRDGVDLSVGVDEKGSGPYAVLEEFNTGVEGIEDVDPGHRETGENQESGTTLARRPTTKESLTPCHTSEVDQDGSRVDRGRGQDVFPVP